MSGLLCNVLSVGCDDDEQGPPAEVPSISVGTPPARPSTGTSEDLPERPTERETASRGTSLDETSSIEPPSTRSSVVTSTSRTTSSSVQTSSTSSTTTSSSPGTSSITPVLSTISRSLESTASDSRDNTSNTPTLSAGPIIGISLAGIAALVFLAWLLMYCCKMRRRVRDHQAIANWNSVEDLTGAGRAASPAPLMTDRDSNSDHSYKAPMSEVSSAPYSMNSPRQPMTAFGPPPPPPGASFRGPLDRVAPPVFHQPFMHPQQFPPQFPYVPNQQAGSTDYAFASAMMR